MNRRAAGMPFHWSETQGLAPDVKVAAVQRIKLATASHQVYQALQEAIVQCQLGPGEALSDRLLAERLAVSRTPVREALAQLEASGLVKRQQNRGWVVADFNEQDIVELYQLRRIFEIGGLSGLADYPEQAVQELASFFDQVPTLPDWDSGLDDYTALDARFHESIIKLSGNARLLDFYGVVAAQIDRVRHYVAARERPRLEQSLVEHHAVCQAIGDRDVVEATELLEQHINQAEHNMLALLQKERDDPAATT